MLADHIRSGTFDSGGLSRPTYQMSACRPAEKARAAIMTCRGFMTGMDNAGPAGVPS
jgi:hypothetical protein